MTQDENSSYRDGDEYSQALHQEGDTQLVPHIEEGPTHHWQAVAPSWSEGVDNQELEKEIYDTQAAIPANHEEFLTISVRVKGDDCPEKIDDFNGIKMHPLLLDNIKRCKYDMPTPIQKYAIPIINERRDLIACAQTGSGKTAAFLIPIVNRMLLKGAKKMGAGPVETPGMRYSSAAPLALIIVPTRELASQIFNEARKFAYKSWIKPKTIYGGASNQILKQELRDGCDILVATTGKLIDYLTQGIVTLTKVKFVIIDEADRMLEMGFQEDLEQIILRHGMPEDDLSTAMFSATWPKEIRHLTGQFLNDPLAVTVGAVSRVTEGIVQEVMWVEELEKRNTLLNLFAEEMEGLALIFVGTKVAVDSLDDFLFKQDVPVTSIHAGRSMSEREDSIAAFRQNKCPIMIATELAARGLDIPNCTKVINYDMPKTIADYIHRIGRTARVGNTGTAISFYNESNSALGPDLAKLLKNCKQNIPDFLQQYAPEETDEGLNQQDDLSPEDLKADPNSYQEGAGQTLGGTDGEEWGTNNNAGNEVAGEWGTNNDGGNEVAGEWGTGGTESANHAGNNANESSAWD